MNLLIPIAIAAGLVSFVLLALVAPFYRTERDKLLTDSKHGNLTEQELRELNLTVKLLLITVMFGYLLAAVTFICLFVKLIFFR